MILFVILKLTVIIISILKSNDHSYVILEYPKLLIDEYKEVFDFINSKNSLEIIVEKTKIEKIFIFITIFPFLQKNLMISRTNPHFKLVQQILNINDTKSIKLNKNSQNLIYVNLKELLYYKWEKIPNKNITNYIRHILYHYYPDNCTEILDKSLNFNIKHIINKYNANMTYELINDLMSKILYI